MPTQGRLRKKDHKFQATLGYRERPCLKKQASNNNKTQKTKRENHIFIFKSVLNKNFTC
jgi:hypothetical protein